MAKIAIFHQSPILLNNQWQSLCFFDGFISSLMEHGNDVLQFITNDFLRKAWNGNNEPRHEQYSEQVISELKAFQPDLVITFNHSFLKDLENILTCPIAIWEADSISYFSDQDTIRKNPERYHFIAFSENVLQNFGPKLNAPSNRIHRIRNATSIKNRSIEKKYNISFIGTCFQIPNVVTSLLKKHPTKTLDIIRNIENMSEDEASSVLRKIGINPKDLKTADILYCKTGQTRNQILDLVAPIGLTIFGDLNWKNCYEHSLNLALAYNDNLVFSLKHNEAIYNSSKVAINISHGQAITGYPWRVLDILASGAALVSDCKKDLVADFGDKVPLQLYQSPVDAYELTKKLVNDEPMRADTVARANAAIEENYRWHHRFKELENIFSIKLFNPDKQGSHEIFRINELKLDQLIFKITLGGVTTLKALQSNKQQRVMKKSLLLSIAEMLPHSVYFALYKIIIAKRNGNRTPYQS